MSDYAEVAAQYGRDVLSGKIPACKWVKAACQRQIDDLARAGFPYIYDLERGARVCRFVEMCPHIKGELAGRLIVLEAWQVFVLFTAFAWVDQFGYRRFRRVYIEVPRGNGKSALSSAVGLYMLTADGEGGAEVYSLATTQKQARIVFGDAQAMARRSPGMRAHFGLTVATHNMYVIETASKFEALSSEASTMDGLNVHFGCIDELHAHRTRAVYDVVETAIGKRRQSLLWVITTAGTDRSGICYEVRGFLLKLLNGVLLSHGGLGYEIKGGSLKDESQFGIVYTIDDADEWTDEAALIKANPNWGVSVMPDVVLQLQQKAMQMASAANNFMTKHLNRWVNADVAWMNMQAWEACADPTLDIEDFAGQDCILASDLATKTDIAARVVLFRKMVGGIEHFYIFTTFYLPEEAANDEKNSQYEGWAADKRLRTTPGNVTDFSVIEGDIRVDAARFRVTDAAFDPWQAAQMIQNLAKDGLDAVEYRQTVQNMSQAMKEVEALVLSGRLHHDGCPVMEWMMANVVCHVDAKENIYPRKEKAENKIDGPVALIMAVGVAINKVDNQGDLSAFLKNMVIV